MAKSVFYIEQDLNPRVYKAQLEFSKSLLEINKESRLQGGSLNYG